MNGVFGLGGAWIKCFLRVEEDESNETGKGIGTRKPITCLPARSREGVAFLGYLRSSSLIGCATPQDRAVIECR